MQNHPKMVRIYADIVQNPTLPKVFPNICRVLYVEVGKTEQEREIYLKYPFF